jgi:hypothetical protein
LSKHDAKTALDHFEKAKKAARLEENQEYLARGLHAVGRDNESAAILETISKAPFRILLDRGNQWFGLWGDSIFEYLKLHKQADPFSCDAYARYLGLRPNNPGTTNLNSLWFTRCTHQ